MDSKVNECEKKTSVATEIMGPMEAKAENIMTKTGSSNESNGKERGIENQLQNPALAASVDRDVPVSSPAKGLVHSGTAVLEENTQMLVDDVTCNAIAVESASSQKQNILRPSVAEIKKSGVISLDSKTAMNDFSSAKLEETVVIESDEETKKEDSSGEKMIDLKSPVSPQDLFASQIEDESNAEKPSNVEESGTMDFEDLIPPSQSDDRSGSQKLDSSENILPSVRKRKREENSQVLTDSKIPKVQGTCDEASNAAPFGEDETSKESKELQEYPVKETESSEISGVREGVEEKEKGGVEESRPEQKGLAKGFVGSRKSVEIVFTSLSGPEKEEARQCGQEFVPSIPEQNCESLNSSVNVSMNDSSFNDSQNLVLRLSMSPTQVDIEEKGELENSPGGTEPLNSTSLLAKTTIQKSSSSLSHSNSTPSKDPKESSEVVTIDEENDELQVLSVKKPSVTTTVEKTCQENGTSKHDSDGADGSIVIDEDKEEPSSPSVNHKDINGPLPKRRRIAEDVVPESNNKGETTDELEQLPGRGLQKRTRVYSTNAQDDRSTPDIVPLPNKGNFQSTPFSDAHLSGGTPWFSTSGTLSAGRLECQEESPDAPDEEVETSFMFWCSVRAKRQRQTKQITAIELVECQEIDCALPGKNPSSAELSSGYSGDMSRNSSPSSVTSLGTFQLKSQPWRLSTSSSSTASSGLGVAGYKSKSFPFSAPVPPDVYSRSVRERQKNPTFSPDCGKDFFEIVEKRLNSDEGKVPSLQLKASSASMEAIPAAPVADERLEEVGNSVPETPRSSKKSRIGRSKSSSRNSTVKAIKEIKEEDTDSPHGAEKENRDQRDTGTPSSVQRKGRKTPVRSGKRTPVNSSAGGEAGSRGRRIRSEANSDKTNSQEPSEHTYEWDSESCFSKLMPDAPVFARWTDKKYYSGKVKEKAKDGRWLIQFDDNSEKALKEEFIIPINHLIKGQIVFAEDNDEYEQGIICEFKVDKKNEEVLYGLELDNGRKVFVPRSRLSMTEDQARLLQENMDPKSPTISSPSITTVTCDNIIQHKRPRLARPLFGTVESPGVSGVAKSSKRSGKSDLTQDTSCSSSVSDSNDKGPLVEEVCCGVDPEVPSYFPELLHTPSGRGKGPGRIKSKSRTPRRNAATPTHPVDTEDHGRVTELLGPIPEMGSNLFTGYCFLLSYAGVKPAASSTVVVSAKTASGKNSDISCSDEELSKFPFVREHLKKQIEAGGGEVFEHFEDVPKDKYKSCFLVTDKPSFTAKYILCLANNIKIILHDWIILRCKGQDLNWISARLDDGWDIEAEELVRLESSVRRKQKPFHKKEIGLANDSPIFIKFWGQVLELLGASVRHITNEPGQDVTKMKVIVTDSTCPPDVQERARECGIDLVSPMWILQSLITWKARSYNGHPHYRYDYYTSD